MTVRDVDRGRVGSASASWPLAGRDTEYDLLVSAIAPRPPEPARSVVITGPPGVGRTLVESLLWQGRPEAAERAASEAGSAGTALAAVRALNLHLGLGRASAAMKSCATRRRWITRSSWP